MSESKGCLVLLTVTFSFLIVVALVYKQRDQPQQIAISTESPVSKTEIKEETENLAASIEAPEPIVIKSLRDIRLIPEGNLRSFVRRVDFRVDKVLYFEWQGVTGDKMTSDMMGKDKKCIITLRLSQTALIGQDVLHRQIFVVPITYSYVCEVAAKN